MKSPILLYALIAFAAVMIGAALLSPIRNRTAGRPDVVERSSDGKLAEAVVRARSELPEFIEALKANPQGEFAVCARFLTKQGPEQLWVRVERHEGKSFFGTLASVPIALEKKKGDSVEVAEGIVVDWTYRIDGKTEGGFTSKVLNEGR